MYANKEMVTAQLITHTSAKTCKKINNKKTHMSLLLRTRFFFILVFY